MLIYFLARVIIVPTLILPLLYIVMFAVYGVILYLFKEITKDDITLVSEMIPGWLVKKFK